MATDRPAGPSRLDIHSIIDRYRKHAVRDWMEAGQESLPSSYQAYLRGRAKGYKLAANALARRIGQPTMKMDELVERNDIMFATDEELEQRVRKELKGEDVSQEQFAQQVGNWKLDEDSRELVAYALPNPNGPEIARLELRKVFDPDFPDADLWAADIFIIRGTDTVGELPLDRTFNDLESAIRFAENTMNSTYTTYDEVARDARFHERVAPRR